MPAKASKRWMFFTLLVWIHKRRIPWNTTYYPSCAYPALHYLFELTFMCVAFLKKSHILKDRPMGNYYACGMPFGLIDFNPSREEKLFFSVISPFLHPHPSLTWAKVVLYLFLGSAPLRDNNLSLERFWSVERPSLSEVLLLGPDGDNYLRRLSEK